MQHNSKRFQREYFEVEHGKCYEHETNILLRNLFHRRRSVELGYFESDEFVKHIPRCELIHGRWRDKLGYVDGDKFGINIQRYTSLFYFIIS